MGNADIGTRIRSSVKELGNSTIELIKATGSCQMSPQDSFALRDVSENARSVGEKVNISTIFDFSKKCNFFLQIYRFINVIIHLFLFIYFSVHMCYLH